MAVLALTSFVRRLARRYSPPAPRRRPHARFAAAPPLGVALQSAAQAQPPAWRAAASERARRAAISTITTTHARRAACGRLSSVCLPPLVHLLFKVCCQPADKEVMCTNVSERIVCLRPGLQERVSVVRGRSKDIRAARCKLCPKTKSRPINIGTMGRSAFLSHASGKKHKENLAAVNTTPSAAAVLQHASSTPRTGLASSGAGAGAVDPDDPPPRLSNSTLGGSAAGSGSLAMALVETEEDIVAAAPSRSAQSQGLINKYLLHDAVTKAEIIWCLQAATRIHSNRTAADCVSLFPLMFSDSEIAKKMQLQKDKVGYLVVYGLAPFFRKQLLETYSVCDHITVGFDEALNDFSTKKQMDLVTRFWDPVTDLVSTRYLSSVFLQKATAKDLRLGIKEAIGPEIEKKMLQISMDGPSVNFSMLKDYQKELKEDHGGTTLVDIGSCGLHVVHGAFKTGVETTTWELKEFLISLHYLFYKSPARRGHFTKTTGSMEFPVPFCFTRWVENDKAGSRAIAMLPHLRTWVEEVQREGRANPLNKGHKNFDRVTRALNDRLLLPKLSFFVSTAKMVEPFLTKFQSDDPMAPLLFREIESLTIELLERVVKKNVLHAASRVIDVKLKDDNLVVAKDFDLGFATKAAIREANNSKPQKILDSVILQFRKECMAMYVRMVEKIQERSPLGYKMTRAISCLDPIVVCETQNLAEERVNVALDILCNSRNWISGAKADRIKSAYSALLRVPSVTARLKEFNGTSPRLDKLWTEVVAAAPSSVPNKDDLMYFIKMVLILYHSNAALERSFSLNNDCMVVNQKETSLIANRVVQDAVLAAGGVEKIAIPKALVLAARNSHSLYREAKEARSKEEKEAAAKVAEKRKATRQIEILAKKKKEILQSAQLEASDIESQINKLR